MGRSILKFSAEVVPRCPFGPKTAKKWKTPPPKCVTFDFTLIWGGREQAGWAGPPTLMISGRPGGRGVGGRRPGRPAEKSKISKIITVTTTTAGL